MPSHYQQVHNDHLHFNTLEICPAQVFMQTGFQLCFFFKCLLSVDSMLESLQTVAPQLYE